MYFIDFLVVIWIIFAFIFIMYALFPRFPTSKLIDYILVDKLGIVI